MKASELKSLSIEALNEKNEALLKEQFTMRIKAASGNPVKPHQFKVMRRDIARVKTIIHEKNLQERTKA